MMMFGFAGLILMFIYSGRKSRITDDLMNMFFVIGGIFLIIWFVLFLIFLLAENISPLTKIIIGIIPIVVLLIWFIVVHVKYPPDKKDENEE